MKISESEIDVEFIVNQNTMNHHQSWRFPHNNLFEREGTSNLDYDYEEEMRSEFDFVKSVEDPPDVFASFEGPLPKEITIVVSLGYDKSFLEHTGIML